MPSYDHIADLLQVIESQKFNYVLAIIEPKPNNKKEDIIKVFTSLDDEALEKLADILKKSKKFNNKNKDGK